MALLIVVYFRSVCYGELVWFYTQAKEAVEREIQCCRVTARERERAWR